MKKPDTTSWGSVATWYDDMLKDPDSYQKNVLMPNLIRIVAPKKGMAIVDLACGQGYFSRAFAENGADVTAYDISRELIDLAKMREDKEKAEAVKNEPTPTSSSKASERKAKPSINKEVQKGRGKLSFHVSPADSIPFIAHGTVDAVTIILALQNIENMSDVIAECARVLKPGGRLILVMNHPAFRIAQSSSWGWDEQKEIGISKDGKIENGEVKMYRRIDSYMSDKTLSIDMTPGEKDPKKKTFTVSFHRPLQSYFKALNKSGLAVTRLEEWISHKKSQKGPRGAEEDRMRKEIPMFVCLEAKKV